MTKEEMKIIHNKQRCMKCKYHGFLSNQTSTMSKEYRLNNCTCDYGIITHTSCLYSKDKKLYDKRGLSADNCNLFEEGKRITNNRKILY